MFLTGGGLVVVLAVVGVAFVLLCVAATHVSAIEGVAVVLGATAALLVDDLHERLMLGDVGANVLGACLGTGVVLASPFAVRAAVLVAVAALNVLGELSSFTRRGSRGTSVGTRGPRVLH